MVDLRETRVRQIAGKGRGGRLAAVELDGRKVDCDVLVMSGGRQPAYALLAHAGARVEYDHERGIFVPIDLPDGVEVVGAPRATSARSPSRRPRSTAPRRRASASSASARTSPTRTSSARSREGFDSIELAKRYTTVTMGPCQGKLCHVPSIRLYARENETDEAAIGTTTARPPWQPVELGLLAGRGHEAAQRTSHAPPPQGARGEDDVDGRLAAPALLRRPGGRGEERPRRARRDRRLHAREGAGQRAGLGGVPGAAVPEPLRRHEAGARPLRRPQLGRGPDHGRRHDRAASEEETST